MNKYYPLHVHTAGGSVGDSVLTIPEYIARAKEYGLDALAITDHGSLNAMYEFYDACKKAEIKPIIGMEAYVTDDNTVKDAEHKAGSSFHLVLLAKNEEGLRNLVSIHNNAAIDGFYYKPRTDWEHLQKWGKGIIALSACVAGEIPQAILENDADKALNLIDFYKGVFDEFYLELQPGSFEEQKTVNEALIELAAETDTPLVITNDIHYLDKEDAVRHDYHVKLGRKSKKLDEQMIYPDSCYWFMNIEAIKENMSMDEYIVEEAINNAAHIAEVCNVEVDDSLHMPQCVDLPEGVTEEEALYEICHERLEELIKDKDNAQVYIDRLEHELEVIKQKGFCGYFLIVADYIEWARSQGIPVGPGRGSAAGSLVTYLLNICQADPIQHGLMFERFLDPCRASIPDIDVDFGSSGRDRIFDYMVEHYGYEHCTIISTMMTRKTKGAIHDAARILGYEPKVGNEIAALIPDVYYGDDGNQKKDLDIKTSLEVVPELQKMQKAYPDIIKLAGELAGLPSAKGVHAAGVLVSPVDLTEGMPLIKPSREGILASALTLEDAERQAVKFDMLALSHLDILKAVEDMIGWHFDFRNEELFHDEKVWATIGSNNTTGIFQIGSNTYKARMPRLAPTTLDELAACLALVRGPCISNKTDELYMQIIEGKQKIRKVHPIYDEVMKSTNGIMIFQEQIIKLIVAFGFDLPTGYTVMKYAQKKKVAQLKEFRPKFIEQAMTKQCDEKTANKIFDMIVDAGLYSFNMAHAISYGSITYASAYLKTHYPLEFACALLTDTWSRGKDKEYKAVYEDCIRNGIKFLPASAKESKWNFTIEDGKIRVGLCAIKGLGEKAVKVLAAHTQDHYETIAEFVECLNEGEPRVFNKKAMTVAIYSGLFDYLLTTDDTRTDLYQQYLDYRGGKEEVPVEIKLGTKDFIIHPDDDKATLEIAFSAQQFVYSQINSMESTNWRRVKNHNLFTEAYGIIQRVKKSKDAYGDQMAEITIAMGDGIVDGTVAYPELKKYAKQIRKNSRIVFSGLKRNNNACTIGSVVKVD